MSHKREDVRILIIGAGLAGISTAIALKDKLGFTNFAIYEQASTVGGTWRDNTYPGCACDVPSHWYSLSTELNPDWSQTWSGQPEILTYWESIVAKHQLETSIQFNSRVDSVEWDSSLHIYKVTATDTQNNETRLVEANIVVSAIGGFLKPQYPEDLPGVNVFKGDIWHSARWNHTAPLSNRRVAVIGNGCSAAQFFTELAKDPTTQLVNFCRTPSWFVPRAQKTYSSLQRWIFRNIPLALRIYRATIMSRMDLEYLIVWPKGSLLKNMARKTLTGYIKKKAPRKWHKNLIPDYPPGCKRLVLNPGYLECLHQPNVDMNWDGIEAITETGIITKKGREYEFDTVIFGTGFEIMSTPLKIIGNRGQNLMGEWQEVGPSAYLGTTIPGYPNFFMLLGPNTATGHASVIFTEEAQINYILRLIKPIIDGKIMSLEVKENANEKYNASLQRDLSDTVYTQCHSWYRTGSQSGKIFVTYPAPVTKFWWNTLVPRWKDYQLDGVTNWSPPGKFMSLLKALFVL